MKILVIMANPHPTEESFNHAIAKTATQTLQNNGHEVISHDLYKEKFDPILGYEELQTHWDLNFQLASSNLDPVVKRHCEELSEADGLVIIHPNWWSQPPAILKGWLDRVFRPGVAFSLSEYGEEEVGLLKAKTALIFNTSITPEEMEYKVYGDPLENLWGNCILSVGGIKHVYRKMYIGIDTSTLEQRKTWLKDVADRVNKYFPASS